MPASPDRYRDLERALDGIRSEPENAAAWSEFYRVIVYRVRGQLFMLGEHDRDRIDDLSHDVLLRFLRYSPWRTNWRSLAAPPEVIAYVRKTTYSVFVEAHRKTPWAFESSVDPSQLDYLAGSLGEDLGAKLHILALDLSEQDRALLQLLLDGRKLPDIADILGIEYSAAGTRVSRLKERLKKMVQKR